MDERIEFFISEETQIQIAIGNHGYTNINFYLFSKFEMDLVSTAQIHGYTVGVNSAPPKKIGIKNVNYFNNNKNIRICLSLNDYTKGTEVSKCS